MVASLQCDVSQCVEMCAKRNTLVNRHIAIERSTHSPKAHIIKDDTL